MVSSGNSVLRRVPSVVSFLEFSCLPYHSLFLSLVVEMMFDCESLVPRFEETLPTRMVASLRHNDFEQQILLRFATRNPVHSLLYATQFLVYNLSKHLGFHSGKVL
jgi:hypothetical protein